MVKDGREDSFLPQEMTGNSIRAWPRMELGFHDHAASQVSFVFLARYFYSSMSSRPKLINILILFSSKHYNRLSVLTDTETKRSEKVFERIGLRGYLKSPRCSILRHSTSSSPLVMSKYLRVTRKSREMARLLLRAM